MDSPRWPVWILPQRHWLSLSVNHIFNRCDDGCWLPQISRASMASPPPTPRSLPVRLVQSAAGICLDAVQNCFRRLAGRNHDMHMTGTHVCRQEIPLTVGTNLSNRSKYYCTLPTAEFIGRLFHFSSFRGEPPTVRRNKGSSRKILFPVHGARIIAMQTSTVTTEGDQVSQRY